MQNTLFLFSFLCVLGATPVTNAAMYKWIDDDGNTHYTQTPPPKDIEGVSIKPPPKNNTEAALKALEAQEKNATQLRDERIKQVADIEKQKQQQSQSKQRCEQSQARLASYQRPRVRVTDQDGNSKIIAEEARQSEIEKSNGYIKEHCSK